jgi:hypothetical protein
VRDDGVVLSASGGGGGSGTVTRWQRRHGVYPAGVEAEVAANAAVGVRVSVAAVPQAGRGAAETVGGGGGGGGPAYVGALAVACTGLQVTLQLNYNFN